MAPPLSSQETVLAERLATSTSHDPLTDEQRSHKLANLAMPPAFSALELVDIDDFDRLHPYVPNPVPADAATVPIPRTSKNNSNNVVQLHHLCDQRGVVPHFDYSGDVLAGGFLGRVEFGGYVLETAALSPSKKAAKEAAAELAVGVFDTVKEGLVGIKRKKGAGGDGGDGGEGDDVDRSENWIGLLVEYTQRMKTDYPEYQEYITEGLPPRFGATVRFTGSPEAPFGDTLGPFSSKTKAKRAAAKEAITWLRDQGLVCGAPVKRLEPDSLDTPSTPTASTSLSRSQNGKPNPPKRNQMSSGDPNTAADLPAPTRLHHLAASLGLVQPRFDCRPSSRTPGDPPAVPLYDAAVYFDPRDVGLESKLAGPVGKVERVLGQKRAKTACYQHAICLLEGLKRDREG